MSDPVATLDRRTLMATLAIALLLGLFAMNDVAVGVFQDDGHYLILARALALGDGYRYTNLPGAQLLEWNGALRWLATDADAAAVRAAAQFGGGHATLFRGGDKAVGVFHALPPALHAIERRLKRTFDPAGIFNPGRLYSDF